MATAKQVRSWAKTQGFEVAVRGLIAPAIWGAYAEAHGDDTREKPERANAARGVCTKCGREWGGLREAHCTVCHRHFSTVTSFDMHKPGECLDPLTINDKHGEPKLQVRESVWGPLYVRAGEHFMTNTYEGLFDAAE